MEAEKERVEAELAQAEADVARAGADLAHAEAEAAAAEVELQSKLIKAQEEIEGLLQQKFDAERAVGSLTEAQQDQANRLAQAEQQLAAANDKVCINSLSNYLTIRQL